MSPFRAGHAANVLALALTFSFVVTIVYKPLATSLFSRSYLNDGFCVSFPDTAFNSHALCFYVDALFTAALGWLCWRHQTTASMARVRENYWGVLGHGFGHLGLYVESRFASESSVSFTLFDSASLLHYALWPVLFGFWFSFFIKLTPSKLFNAALSLLNTIVLGVYVPRLYAFTYVQTMLMAVFVVRDLFDVSRKDEWYNLWSWCVNVPVLIMGWIEAVTCDTGLVHVGGHVWYDAIIPISVLVYAAVALSRPASASASQTDALAKKAS